MRRKRRLFITGIVSVVCMFFFAAFGPQPIYAEYGEGTSCRTSEGYSGTCYSRDRVSCSGYYDAGWYCPGDDSVQCCVSRQISCRSATGICHNRYMNPSWLSGGSNNGNIYSCNGSWYSGYCPGPYDVQCCVEAPTRTPTPTPTRTPTPSPTRTPTPTPTRFNQSTTTPGIIFSGNSSTNFGLRGQTAASVRSWVVGGLTYPEVYPSANYTAPTSYQYILSKATRAQFTIRNLTSVSGCSSLANCTLPANLANGVYRANGSLTLNAYNFPSNNNYVFLVNGDLRIRGNIGVPNSSTAFFTASRDIIIPSNVGAPSNAFPLPDAQIQGIFSANRNFVIQGINNCITGPDRMLNIEGAIVVNAGGAGGSLISQRDLCGSNPTIPAFTIRGRMDFLLNLPEFLMHQRTTFKEAAP